MKTMENEIRQCKVVLGRFQPFTLGHLKIATYTDLKGPDKEQADALREQPNLEEISKLPTIILAILVPNDKIDSRHPFYAELMEEEFERIKENYKEVRDVFYVSSADICAWGEFLKKNNYQAAVWITGSDEFKPYKYMSMKLPQYEEHNRDNRDIEGAFTKSFYVEEVQRNDSSDDFVSTISATKVREALENDNKESFKKMMPKGTDYLFDKFKEALAKAPKAPEKKSRKKIKECISTIKPIDIYLTEKLKINKNTQTNNYKPEQGEHDKSRVYDDIWNDIKDSLYLWNAGPVYGFRGDKGVSFQVNLDGKYKGYWIVIKYNYGSFRDDFLITLSKYATDEKSDCKDWEDGIYAGDETRVINNLLELD